MQSESTTWDTEILSVQVREGDSWAGPAGAVLLLPPKNSEADLGRVQLRGDMWRVDHCDLLGDLGSEGGNKDV